MCLFGIVLTTASLPLITNKVMENWRFLYKYFKPTLKKLCEKEPDNLHMYDHHTLASYFITPNLATAETPFFLVYEGDPKLRLHQFLEPMQLFLGDSDSGCLELESHCFALAIAKKTLDENHIKHAQTMMHCTTPNFKVGNRVFFKKQATWQIRSKMESWLQNCLHRVQRTLPTYRKSSYRKTRPCYAKGVYMNHQ